MARVRGPGARLWLADPTPDALQRPVGAIVLTGVRNVC